MTVTLPPADKSRLAALLASRSYEKRDVTLASGKKSDFYLDCKNTTLHPEGLYLAGRFFLEAVRRGSKKIAAVGGPTLGSDPIAAAMAVLSHLDGAPLPAFIIRKEAKGHGTRAWVEGGRFLENGTQVAIVEDVVTSGGSSLKAAEKDRDVRIELVAAVSTRTTALAGLSTEQRTGRQIVTQRVSGDSVRFPTAIYRPFWF